MTRGLAVGWSLTAPDYGDSGWRVGITAAQLSHDPLRTPQIHLSATTTAPGLSADPRGRNAVLLQIDSRSYAAGTLAQFDEAEPTSTLGDLAWSERASTVTPHGLTEPYLGEEEPAIRDSVDVLELFVTKYVDNHNGTWSVEAMSADGLLEDIVNCGPAWTPEPVEAGYRTLKSSLRQLLELLEIPLEVPDGHLGDVGILNADLPAWEPGESARSWLDALRQSAGAVWMVSATQRTMQPRYTAEAGLGWYWSAAIEEQTELSTEVSDITGHARWCDGYRLEWRWTEPGADGEDVERVQVDLATLDGMPWQRCRKILTETQERRPTELTAQQRLERAQLYGIQTAATVPVAQLPAPYLDLTTWERARPHLAELTYHYPAATAAVTMIGL